MTMTPAGLEPAIPGSVGRCLIHWATGPIDHKFKINSEHLKDPTNGSARAALPLPLLRVPLYALVLRSLLASKVAHTDVCLAKA